MKSLPQAGGEAEWQNKLVDDLAYIKKNLRYPISRATALPVVMAAMLLAIIPLTAYWVIFQTHIKGHGSIVLPVLLIVLLATVGIVTAFRFLTMLRFIVVPTPFFSTENQALMLRFLREQQLAVFRHPEAPEVFQILSKNIDLFKEDREVIIFITDDKRILINSHFTGSRTARIGHHKEMAGMLRHWLNANSNSSTTGIVHQSL